MKCADIFNGKVGGTINLRLSDLVVVVMVVVVGGELGRKSQKICCLESVSQPRDANLGTKLNPGKILIQNQITLIFLISNRKIHSKTHFKVRICVRSCRNLKFHLRRVSPTGPRQCKCSSAGLYSIFGSPKAWHNLLLA